VRDRRWVVVTSEASALQDGAPSSASAPPQHLLILTSIEDEEAGSELRVVWELEPGREVIEEAALPEVDGDRRDDPARDQRPAREPRGPLRDGGGPALHLAGRARSGAPEGDRLDGDDQARALPGQLVVPRARFHHRPEDAFPGDRKSRASVAAPG
jgi:hypothetical protein